MNKMLRRLLRQYVGCSVLSVTADGVVHPWPVREALTCERLDLLFDRGPLLTLSAAGEDHFYGEQDLLVDTSERPASAPTATPEQGPDAQGKYWQHEPRGLRLLLTRKYLMHVEFRWATGSLSAGYLVASPGRPLAIDLDAVHLTTVWLDGTAERLEQALL
ncbi:MAG TPA: hypothetical protein VF598_02255 [Hymenobacter sp.]|jgi:hypothetical protein